VRYNLFPEAEGVACQPPLLGKDCPATAAEASSLDVTISTTVS
jgi:hypothetical protein